MKFESTVINIMAVIVSSDQIVNLGQRAQNRAIHISIYKSTQFS